MQRLEYSFADSLFIREKSVDNRIKIRIQLCLGNIQNYGFDYTAEPGMYELYSYADIVAGRCDMRVFQGSIVLVGAYSSGMMEKKEPAISAVKRGKQ